MQLSHFIAFFFAGVTRFALGLEASNSFASSHTLIHCHSFLPHLVCAHPQRLFWPWQHHEQNATGHPANTSVEHTPHPTWRLQWQRHRQDAAVAPHGGGRSNLWSLRWSIRLGLFRGGWFGRSYQTWSCFGDRALGFLSHMNASVSVDVNLLRA